jgi:hypothetical protein
MRDPGIHLTRSQFEEILGYLEITQFPTEAFFVMAKKKAVNARAVLVSNKKDNKKITNVLLASTGDAQLVADLLYATRIKLKHRGVRKITPSNTRDWANCKKLAEICNVYCNDFQLDTREGFIDYINHGITMMGKNLNNITQRLIQMADNITSEKSAEAEMKELSQYKEVAEDIYNYYVKKIASSTGIYTDYNNRDKVWFYRVAAFLDEKHWLNQVDDFIEAQFEALSYCNGIPGLQTLTTAKAIERFNKYLYKSNQTQESLPEEETGSLWDKIN